MPKKSPNDTVATQKAARRLVRGIDVIPAAVERASETRAAFALLAALATLNQLAAKAPTGHRRSLMKAQRLVRVGVDHATGGFWVDRDGNLV